MDCLFRLQYKSYCPIKNSKEPLDGVTFFVKSLINSDDESDVTYSGSQYEDGNDNNLEEDYYDDEEDIFDDFYFGDIDGEEEEYDDAIDFQIYLKNSMCFKQKGEENQS